MRTGVDSIQLTMQQSKTRLAFTLLELLVTVGIIGIVASLLLPALGKAKAKAQSTYCLNSLKQIGLAINLYAGDYDGILIPADQTNAAGQAFLWFPLLGPYLGQATNVTSGSLTNGNNVIWGCPTYKQNPTMNSSGVFTASYPGYGLSLSPMNPVKAYNSCLLSPWVIFKLDNIDQKSSRIMAGDDSDWEMWNFNLTNVCRTRHGSGANYIFFDFHVEGLKPLQASNSCFTPANGY